MTISPGQIQIVLVVIRIYSAYYQRYWRKRGD